MKQRCDQICTLLLPQCSLGWRAGSKFFCSGMNSDLISFFDLFDQLKRVLTWCISSEYCFCLTTTSKHPSSTFQDKTALCPLPNFSAFTGLDRRFGNLPGARSRVATTLAPCEDLFKQPFNLWLAIYWMLNQPVVWLQSPARIRKTFLPVREKSELGCQLKSTLLGE